MDHIYHQYINMISGRLRNFRKLSRNKYNFSCPICGDSKTNTNKARGVILSKGTDVFYYCHNDPSCNSSFDYFLKRIDANIARQFRLEKFRQSVIDSSIEQTSDIVKTPPEAARGKVSVAPIDTYSLLQKVVDLPLEHPARMYIDARKIPDERMQDIWYTDTWLQFTNTVCGSTVIPPKDHPRVVFPLRDKNHLTFAFQGRTLNNNIQPKYLTCKLDADAVKLFGQEKINEADNIFILEGPIDSMFIRNAVAMAGSDLSLDNCPYIHNRVFVLDNEPRSKVIVAKYHKLLKAGEKVVSWKNCKWTDKDINDMVLNNKSCNVVAINKYLRDNIISGLRGKLEIDQWKKC